MFDRDSELIWENYKNKNIIKLVQENSITSGMNLPPGLGAFVASFDVTPEGSKPNAEDNEPEVQLEPEPEDEEEDEESMVSFKEAFNDVGALASKVTPERVAKWMGDTHADKEYLNKKKATAHQVAKYNALKNSRPILHKSNVGVFEIVNNNGDTIKTYDIDGYKKLLMQRPKSLVTTNEKMAKSGGDTQQFYNTTLPAILGIAVNETTGDLIVVNTCPGADECKNDCYARKGNYVKNKASSINQQRILNYILNDYNGYKEELKATLQLKYIQNKKQGIQTVLRFNDSGDMLSPKYFQMAADLARSMPEVLFYGYTKSVSVAKTIKMPDNFVMNYSMGGTQDNLINSSDKQSVIIYPEKVKAKTGVDLKKLIVKEWYIDDEVNLKKGISKRFNVPLNRVFTVKEVQNAGHFELPEGAVIVKLPDEQIANHPNTHIIDVLQKDPLKPNKKLSESMANVIKSKNIYTGGQQGIEKFKNIMASYFNIDPTKLLTMDELYDTPVGKTNEYNVIVLPLESDLSASRKDVHITFLFLH